MYHLNEKMLLELTRAMDLEARGRYISESILGAINDGNVIPWCKKLAVSRKSIGAYTEEFLTFWAAYPRKMGKGAAFAVWTTYGDKEQLLEECIKALAWQKKNNSFMTYTPAPETYLRQRRFEDEDPIAGAEVKTDMNGMPIR